MTEITITAGETVLDGVLFDNYTARSFADMFPITANLWNPAAGFAKAFDLPSEIPDSDERTRNYELGSLGSADIASPRVRRKMTSTNG